MLAIVATNSVVAQAGCCMKVKRKKIVPHTSQQMYALVNDIRAYPEFITWCKKVDIVAEDESEITASLHIEKGILRRKFTTKNTLHAGHRMDMQLVDGPFKYLHGFWQFDDCGESRCKISFELEFEFSTPMLAAALNPIFNLIANSLVDFFVQRAQEVYE